MGEVGWVRWFPSDWRGSAAVAELSLAERGLYRELLDLQVASGPFRWEPQRLARQLRCDRAELEELWPSVRAFFMERGGAWSNPKMHEEIERGKRLSEAGRKAGRASAEARRRGSTGNDRSNDRRESVGQTVATSPTPTPSVKSPSPPRSARGTSPREGPPKHPAWLVEARADRPVGVSPAAWSGWLEHLRERKKPTAGALASHRRKLLEVVEARNPAAADALLEDCVSNNAQGIPDWAFRRALEGEGTRSSSRRPARGMESVRQAIESGELEIEP